jgi:hypothetical protein
MFYLHLLFFTLIALFSISSPALANDQERQIAGREIKSKMLNIERTFWDHKHLDRYFFKPNGELQHQVNEPRLQIPLGTVMTATHYISNNSLCWKYSDEDTQKYQLSQRAQCFDLFAKGSPSDFMKDHAPKVNLKKVGATATDPRIMRFRYWNTGSYIFDAKFIPALKKGLETIKTYRKQHNGIIPNGTIERDDMRAFMKQYYDDVIGKVFAIDRSYVYFHKGGDYYWIDGKRIDEANGDINKMVSAATKGTWSIRDNIHCWSVSNRDASSCEFVFPPARGLRDRKFTHFLGVNQNYFSRIHDDPVEQLRHIAPEDTELPALFKTFDKISETR